MSIFLLYNYIINYWTELLLYFFQLIKLFISYSMERIGWGKRMIFQRIYVSVKHLPLEFISAYKKYILIVSILYLGYEGSTISPNILQNNVSGNIFQNPFLDIANSTDSRNCEKSVCHIVFQWAKIQSWANDLNKERNY